ncbi:MAG: oxygen-dependent protoporphyrinogen oxidase [Peltula sp. TS41687]|nr:MAG: oxygen-dependent protoporphyrinogen oxidase [Peltula sp. TS41687]
MYSRSNINGIRSSKAQARQALDNTLRRYSSTYSQDVAVIGGGVTGLASAYWISTLPGTRVTLYEKGTRLGGWVNSKHVNVGNGNTVLFEQGPRAIRPSGPNGILTRRLIQSLDLVDQVVTTPDTAVAARNRYIYYPDHLVRVPGKGDGIISTLGTLLTEPLFKGLISGVIGEFFRPPSPPDLGDESVGSFVSRRFSPHVADNVVSALVHGIYAGDIYLLSMRSIARLPWALEAAHGSLIKTYLQMDSKTRFVPQADATLLYHLKEQGDVGFAYPKETAQYSFKMGVDTLVRALARRLEHSDNVTVKTQTEIKDIAYDGARGGVAIQTNDKQPPRTYSSAVCTISGPALSKLTKVTLPTLESMHSVSVMVVNLYYTNPDLLPVHGFGYLIPRSIPLEQNPERALGVVFDSDIVEGQETAAGTRITVMIGGHWWDNWPVYPDEGDGAQMAKAVLRRHLKIEEEPAYVMASLQKSCIPQYTVGHDRRMRTAHVTLQDEFKGLLKVAGSSYTGVGINDCVRAAAEMRRILGESEARHQTGLESFVEHPRWTEVSSDLLDM